MKSYQAADARLKMREILTAVEQGEEIEIKRYDTATAIVVSPGWFELAADTLDVVAAAVERGGFTVGEMEAFRDYQIRYGHLHMGRRAAGLKRTDKRWVDHVDGDPTNNDPANLRIAEPKENGNA